MQWLFVVALLAVVGFAFWAAGREEEKSHAELEERAKAEGWYDGSGFFSIDTEA